jgi:membrane protein DedA with SNARE-associated domain
MSAAVDQALSPRGPAQVATGRWPVRWRRPESSPSVRTVPSVTDLALQVIGHLGEVGLGVLTLVETVFPPLPSEVVLPLGGYLAQRGRFDVGWVMLAATVGSVAGAWVLYLLGARLGADRTAAALARLPLVDREDVDQAAAWFERHGEWAVLIGRVVPGVRSLISIPAGTARMGPVRFTVLTTIGSGVWNGLLIGGGYALGTQYRLVEQYTGVLDTVVISVGVALVAVLIVRRVRRVRRVGSS